MDSNLLDNLYKESSNGASTVLHDSLPLRWRDLELEYFLPGRSRLIFFL